MNGKEINQLKPEKRILDMVCMISGKENTSSFSIFFQDCCRISAF